jgi:dTDP-4-dehydrorhamnose 3,5-epimerase
MKTTPLAIPGVILLEPKIFGDDRGFFFESFNQATFEAAIGRHVTFVQDNHSCSVKNVLRGLHYQIQQAQGKLLRVVQAKCSMWRSISVNPRPPLGNGLEKFYRQRTNAKCGCRKVSRMTSSQCQILPSASTKPLSTMRRNTNAASPGTIRVSGSSGPSTASRFCPLKTSKANHLPERSISYDPHSPLPTHHSPGNQLPRYSIHLSRGPGKRSREERAASSGA